MPKDPNNPKLTCLADNDLQSPEEMRKELRELRGKYANSENIRIESARIKIYGIKWYTDKLVTEEIVKAYSELEKTPGSLGM